MTSLYSKITILLLVIERIKVMKKFMLTITLLLLLIACSENPVNPSDENNEWNIQQESDNFPWELVSGKIAYIRKYLEGGIIIILIDSDTRQMRILKRKQYLSFLTWHYTGTKITGADLGNPGYFGEYRSPSFYCIDLEGNNSSTQYSSHFKHSWSNDGSLASIQAYSIFINEQLSILSDHLLEGTRPAWSTDSKNLVTSIRGNYSEGTYAQLKKFDVITKIGTPLVIADSIGYKFSFKDPIYSPDGNKIAHVHRTMYRYQEISAIQEIWIMDSDGLNKRRLTSGHYDSFPAWSPDGTKIIFQRNTYDDSRESEGIYVINIDRTGLQKILSKGSDMPIWN